MSKKQKPEPFDWDIMGDDFKSPQIVAFKVISAQLDWLIRLTYNNGHRKG